MGREVGMWIKVGNTCKSMADSCQCMAKALQYYKVISPQLIKINRKKKKVLQHIIQTVAPGMLLGPGRDYVCHGFSKLSCGHNSLS